MTVAYFTAPKTLQADQNIQDPASDPPVAPRAPFTFENKVTTGGPGEPGEGPGEPGSWRLTYMGEAFYEIHLVNDVNGRLNGWKLFGGLYTYLVGEIFSRSKFEV